MCDKGEAGGVCFRGESRNLGSDRPQAAPQQEQKEGGGLQTTQTTIDPDKSHSWNCFRFDKWMSWMAFWLSGM